MIRPGGALVLHLLNHDRLLAKKQRAIMPVVREVPEAMKPKKVLIGAQNQLKVVGGLASGWLVTQVGSAPKVLMVNGILLSIVAAIFLIRGERLKDV